MNHSSAHPRHLLTIAVTLLMMAILSACGGGGGSGSSTDSPATVLEDVQSPSSSAPAGVTAAALYFGSTRDGDRTVVNRGGRPLTPAATPWVQSSGLTEDLQDLFEDMLDLFLPDEVMDDWLDLSDEDNYDGPSLKDWLSPGIDNCWVYRDDAEILFGADPVLLFRLSDDTDDDIDSNLVISGDGFFLASQQHTGADAGEIRATPALLWIPNIIIDGASRTSIANVGYTPDGVLFPEKSVHVVRVATLVAHLDTYTTRDNGFTFSNVLHFHLADTVTPSPGYPFTNLVDDDSCDFIDAADSCSLTYDVYIAYQTGVVEVFATDGQEERHTELDSAFVYNRYLPDTDDDGVPDRDQQSPCTGDELISGDNCPTAANPNQEDGDGDDVGDACDDDDGDTYPQSVDCDDNDAAVNPGATETPYNGKDDDCDAATPDDDLDGDGVDGATDCDDSNATVHPDAAEVCDGRDNNCDGTVDEGFDDADGDGVAACAGDCDDSNAAVSPGATETPYNGVDDDCNAATPDDDLDGDGFASATDCDDTNAAVNPAAAEACNGIDDNCDGAVDDGLGDTCPPPA